MASRELRLALAMVIVWVITFFHMMPAYVAPPPCDCATARAVQQLDGRRAPEQAKEIPKAETQGAAAGGSGDADAASKVMATEAPPPPLTEQRSQPPPLQTPTVSPPPTQTPTAVNGGHAADGSSSSSSRNGSDATAAEKVPPPTVPPKPKVTDFKRWPRVGNPTNLDPRRADVVRMLNVSWHGYRQYAWGIDELGPISKKAFNWGSGRGIGSTIVDAIDTLLIAGLDGEAAEALAWIENELGFDQDIKVSGFETTIRVLGGLLSTYQITGRARVLDQAKDLGKRLSRAFEMPAGVPHNYVNLKTGVHSGANWNSGASILSELGSLQMEHYTLSQETGDVAFFTRARRAVEAIAPACHSGYCPRWFHGTKPAGPKTAGLGSFGDSFYEYLLKQWILSGKQDKLFKTMWDKAANHTIDTTIAYKDRVVPNGKETSGTMEHLACFSGGLFALSYMHTNDARHLQLAKDIAETCHAMHKTPTGLPADVVTYTKDGEYSVTDPKYILRPETVETYFYLWRATKDQKYRNWGHELLKAIENHLKVPGVGYAGAKDVRRIPVAKHDNMETFWFAETLKYMYLLFSEDEIIDLHTWVFNTEAHPMRVQAPAKAG